jgi:hypothetical protein
MADFIGVQGSLSPSVVRCGSPPPTSVVSHSVNGSELRVSPVAVEPLASCRSGDSVWHQLDYWRVILGACLVAGVSGTTHAFNVIQDVSEILRLSFGFC